MDDSAAPMKKALLHNIAENITRVLVTTCNQQKSSVLYPMHKDGGSSCSSFSKISLNAG